MADDRVNARIQSASVTRLRTRHEQYLNDFLEQLSHTPIEASGVYFGVWCPRCEQDCLPLNDGTCGWCGTLVEKAA